MGRAMAGDDADGGVMGGASANDCDDGRRRDGRWRAGDGVDDVDGDGGQRSAMAAGLGW